MNTKDKYNSFHGELLDFFVEIIKITRSGKRRRGRRRRKKQQLLAFHKWCPLSKIQGFITPANSEQSTRLIISIESLCNIPHNFGPPVIYYGFIKINLSRRQSFQMK